MENGKLNHLIQNPESANPEQLDELIELYPAISMLKVLKLKSVYETTGIIDQNLWDQLLIEWPDKKSLLKLKSVGFDHNKIMETIVPDPVSTLEPLTEIENFHLTDTDENDHQIEHLGFIYELPTQSISQDNIQNEINESEPTINNSYVVDPDPVVDIFEYLPHLGFLYEYESGLHESTVEIPPISTDIPLVEDVDLKEETSVPDKEIPTNNSIDEQAVQLEEADNPLSAYVKWLKALNQKQHFNISDYEQKKKMKKKSKPEKAEKDKDDRKDRTKTAKKLLKNSKKVRKELAKKQEKSQKKTKKKNELSTIIDGSLKKSPTVITETYADLLAKQGYIEQSKEMYEKLSLLNPEKSTYFAAKILKLKNN